jgi:hypothetical protein
MAHKAKKVNVFLGDACLTHPYQVQCNSETNKLSAILGKISISVVFVV